MAKFNIGDRVIKTGTEKHGVVTGLRETRRGPIYLVQFDDITSNEFEVNLKPDQNIFDPFERCEAGIFGSYTEYAKKNTSFKIGTSNNSTISSLKSSKTLFRAYQFKPLLKFLNSPNRRLLVADEVGLGKTIEAGHIMLELKARRELSNVLIVCPKSLQHKWREELANKFGLKFKIYETQKDLLQDMQQQRVSIHAIINYEKIREKKVKPEGEVVTETKTIVDYLKENEFTFSLVLCDEAHRMRNSYTLTYKGANIIMSRADAVVFLTATPVMISTENLYNLLHLLDNTRFYQYEIFENRLQENRPFVEALTKLNRQEPLARISQELDEATIYSSYSINEREYRLENTVGKAFADNTMYKEIQRMLHDEDSPKARARLQYLISSMSMMNNIFSRTRKREVTTDLSQAERKPHMRKVVLTPEERAEFDAVINEYYDDNSYSDEWGIEWFSKGGALGLVQKKRQVASSVFAYLNTEECLNADIDMYEDYTDAKFEELIRIIEEVFKHGTKKIVIFALFRKTLKYLKIRLKKRGYGALLIHGMVQNRAETLEEFKNNPRAHILLSSEVGSEGLDMQFCNSMVNYDLPWNPMVVEQRIGRIDRFGQKSPIVNIYNIIVADSIQEDIYIRLLDRIGIFRGTIGDMEAILDAPMVEGKRLTIQDVYNSLEKELYTTQLTEEERRRKIEEVELAIANEKETILHLDEGLNTALTNDAYFQDEIKRIQNNNAYVTERELRNYLEMAIKQELSTCSLNEVEDHVYELQLPLSNPKILHNFLTTYKPMDEETTLAFNQFKRDIEGETSIRLTFDQDTAYSNNKLFFLNIYHPIIQACHYYFTQKEDKSSKSFSYALVGDQSLEKGKLYYLIIYKVRVSRKVHGAPKYTETLLPILYDINRKSVVDDEELVERIFARSQTDGKECNPVNAGTDKELIQDMCFDFTEAMESILEKRKAELLLQIQGDNQRTAHQTSEYYLRRIENLKRNISTWEVEAEYLMDKEEKRANQMRRLIHMTEENIKNLEIERDDRIAQINESTQIEIAKDIVSLNLVSVI